MIVTINVPIEVEYAQGEPWNILRVGGKHCMDWETAVYAYLYHAIADHEAADREQVRANQDEEAHWRGLNAEQHRRLP